MPVYCIMYTYIRCNLGLIYIQVEVCAYKKAGYQRASMSTAEDLVAKIGMTSGPRHQVIHSPCKHMIIRCGILQHHLLRATLPMRSCNADPLILIVISPSPTLTWYCLNKGLLSCPGFVISVGCAVCPPKNASKQKGGSRTGLGNLGSYTHQVTRYSNPT